MVETRNPVEAALQPGVDGTDGPRSAADAFGRAIAARNYVGMYSALARDVRLRYLIPSGPGQREGAAETVAKLMEWFGDSDDVRIGDIRAERLADRTSLRYRFLLHEQDGWKEVEQQQYVDVDEGGLISTIDLLCSGFRPAEDPEEATGRLERTHSFDAGALGCADGLAQEFRRRILAIPVGDVLVVETSDPAAKEDLPPMARMMGHLVRSIEPSADGRLLITVERGR